MNLSSRLVRAVLLACGLHLLVLTTPGIAWAQTAATTSPARQDVVYLRSGGMLRGILIDAIPNDRARLQLATGEIATIAWPEIARIERADGTRTEGTAAPPSGPAPAPPSSPPPAPAVMVLVHIDGPEDARLEQDTTDRNDWVTVCSAPCDRLLSTAYSYRFTGSGMKTSTPFTLHGQAGARVTLQVSMASTGWFIAGIVFIPVGGLTAIVGFFVGLVGSLAAAVNDPGGSNLAAAGWTTAAVGLGVTIAGIVLTVTNIRTGVSQEAELPRSTALLDAPKMVPAPVWRDASAEQRALPPVIAAPVFGAAF